MTRDNENTAFESWWVAEQHFGGDARDYAQRGWNAGKAIATRESAPVEPCDEALSEAIDRIKAISTTMLPRDDWRELYNEAYERCPFEWFHKRALELIAENVQTSIAAAHLEARPRFMDDAISQLNGLLDMCEQGSKAERKQARSAIHAFYSRALLAAESAELNAEKKNSGLLEDS